MNPHRILITGATGGIGSQVSRRFDEILRTNVRGAFGCIRAFRPLLEATSAPAVVNMSSVAARTGTGSNVAYCASKSRARLHHALTACSPPSSHTGVVAGGPAPLVAAALLTTNYGEHAIAGYLVICSLISLLALTKLPDRSRIDIS